MTEITLGLHDGILATVHWVNGPPYLKVIYSKKIGPKKGDRCPTCVSWDGYNDRCPTCEGTGKVV